MELFDILIQYNVSVHTADVYGAYPVHYASQLSEIEIIEKEKSWAILKKLIEHNVDIECRDEQGRTPFLWAASVGS